MKDMEIQIGADELILWLRKNGKAQGIPNDEVQGLGFRICRLIESLGGKKVKENSPAYWADMSGDKHIEKYNLPKTSAQYLIGVDCLPEIYKELNRW